MNNVVLENVHAHPIYMKEGNWKFKGRRERAENVRWGGVFKAKDLS